jgi:hypothetical protein
MQVFYNVKPMPTVEVPLPPAIRFVKGLAYWMDNAFEIPVLKWRFGFDAITGLIPAFGDTFTLLLGLFTVAVGIYYKLPWPVVACMVANLLADWLLGLLPVLGDLVDTRFKAHTRNVALLVNHYQWAQPPSQTTLVQP